MSAVEQKLDALLDAVQRALCGSDYAALPGLTDEIAAQLRDLAGVPDAKLLTQLRRKAERNATCLLAAQRGFRAARQRLKDIRSSGSGLVTYDGKGRRVTIVETGNLTQRY